MSPKRRSNEEYPDVQWFREQTASFKESWDKVPWHENGEHALRPLKESMRRYASRISELPENFFPTVLDQYLAVLSEGYEYQILDVTTDLGDDRYLCINEAGQTFCLWSRSATLNIKQGGMTFMTAITRLGPDTDGPVPAITYGPVLSWKSLYVTDFTAIGRELARDLWRLRGIPAVVRRDPVPFWAIWSLGNIPRVKHGTEDVCTCWHEGRFSASPESLLEGGWKRDEIGKRVRFKKPGSKPFFEQVVIYDVKSSRGILLARRGSYLTKLRVSLSSVFTPDSSEPFIASPTLEIAFEDIMKRSLPYVEWMRHFVQLDDKKSNEERNEYPERKAEKDALDAALKELIPYINTHREPDWKAFAAKHGLGPDTIDSLKSFYQKYGGGS